MDMAKELDRPVARPRPGDHRIMAQHECALLVLHREDVVHTVPWQIADPFQIVVADDQMLAAWQGCKSRLDRGAGDLLGKGKVADDPKVIIGQDFAADRITNVAVHLGRGGKRAIAKPDDGFVVQVEVGSIPVHGVAFLAQGAPLADRGSL